MEYNTAVKEAISRSGQCQVVPADLEFLGAVETARATCRSANHRLSDGVQGFKLFPELQSAYRDHHSTATAVLKVLGDILRAIDGGDLTALTLLDLSAAFDTVGHQILLRRLKTSFGLGGSVLNWFASWMRQRCCFVDAGQSIPIKVL